jgi:hypothetical protein
LMLRKFSWSCERYTAPVHATICRVNPRDDSTCAAGLLLAMPPKAAPRSLPATRAPILAHRKKCLFSVEPGCSLHTIV